ncbi:unnamed protein product [Acanthosepion pharaonis]|uniref:Uncharacterized protein n=1 Tax=Acanthosepion pharaonis TaxID=158019 RepID=A0A812D7P7_ACAPH|nr:unnamed protein product [Sepia pharaonis]
MLFKFFLLQRFVELLTFRDTEKKKYWDPYLGDSCHFNDTHLLQLTHRISPAKWSLLQKQSQVSIAPFTYPFLFCLFLPYHLIHILLLPSFSLLSFFCSTSSKFFLSLCLLPLHLFVFPLPTPSSSPSFLCLLLPHLSSLCLLLLPPFAYSSSICLLFAYSSSYSLFISLPTPPSSSYSFFISLFTPSSSLFLLLLHLSFYSFFISLFTPSSSLFYSFFISLFTPSSSLFLLLLHLSFYSFFISLLTPSSSLFLLPLRLSSLPNLPPSLCLITINSLYLIVLSSSLFSAHSLCFSIYPYHFLFTSP